jgi:hypothetical protein
LPRVSKLILHGLVFDQISGLAETQNQHDRDRDHCIEQIRACIREIGVVLNLNAMSTLIVPLLGCFILLPNWWSSASSTISRSRN